MISKTGYCIKWSVWDLNLKIVTNLNFIYNYVIFLIKKGNFLNSCIMKNYLVTLGMGIMLALTVGTTSVVGQPGSKEDQKLITRSLDELLIDKVQERSLIEKNLPQKATVKPEKVRRLLIFDLNVNYGGHLSIDYANYALARMGEKTGAYETVITRDTLFFKTEKPALVF